MKNLEERVVSLSLIETAVEALSKADDFKTVPPAAGIAITATVP